ncbi:MAG: Transcriptional regulator MntR [Firmicutes bacterium ADurb.Bin248]|nr:MAG: Transcriptional regulator MntR [Firmicutes bacterium ADurb.Bin248]
MKIHESAEMYLETILMLGRNGAPVRSIDVVGELDFKKSSVSVAMKKLRENGYVEMDDEGHLTLTPSGRKIAETMYERHTFLSDWLESLGVEKDVAVADACRMEHVISPESFEAIKKHVERCGE